MRANTGPSLGGVAMVDRGSICRAKTLLRSYSVGTVVQLTLISDLARHLPPTNQQCI